ncbi:MAG TPA: hypothetical protein VF885_22325 [Arthrobacter sp.]
MSTATATPTLISVDAEALAEDGYCGGPDYNLGQDFSRRGTWQIGPNRFIDITVTAFVNGNVLDAEGNHLRDAEYNDDIKLPCWDEDEERSAAEYLRPYEEAQVDYFIYTKEAGEDADKVELSSDMERVEEVGHLWPGTIERAEESCRNYVNGYNFERDFDVTVAAKGYLEP